MSATYEHCSCGAWQDISRLGPVCTSCGKPMVAGEHQAGDLAASPILSRKIFQSASLRTPADPTERLRIRVNPVF